MWIIAGDFIRHLFTWTKSSTCATYSELPFDARAMSPPQIKIESKKRTGVKVEIPSPLFTFLTMELDQGQIKCMYYVSE